MTGLFVRDAGTWKEASEIYVRDAGVWKQVEEGFVRDAGVWKSFYKNAFEFTQTISSDTNNYDLRSAAIAAGWDTVTPLDATVTINSGVYVGSTSTGSYAFQTGSGFPAGSVLRLINNGIILGRGGDGGNGGQWSANGSGGGNAGPALLASAAIQITNNNQIAGGGGGGGGGASRYMERSASGHAFAVHGGGGGGGRGGSERGNRGASNNTAISGGQTTISDTRPGHGSAGTLTSAGGGGVAGQRRTQFNSAFGNFGQGEIAGGAGGAGGGLGSSGANGGDGSTPFNPNGFGVIGRTGGAGGPPGNAVVGDNNITWIETGSRIGGIVA